MSKEHTVIFIAGLGDNRTHSIEKSFRYWEKHDLFPQVHVVGWTDKHISYSEKLQILLNLIDRESISSRKVSLVGISAGGSAAINAFVERKHVLSRVINVCGRLWIGPTTGFRSLAMRSKLSPLFEESVRLCEKNQTQLSSDDRKRIMTVRAKFGDEFVPANTTVLSGAVNIQIPVFEHLIAINAALTSHSTPLISFLKDYI